MADVNEVRDQLSELTRMVGAGHQDEGEKKYRYDPYDSDDEDEQEKSILGSGSFGTTHRMRSCDDGQLYAVKMIKVKTTIKIIL